MLQSGKNALYAEKRSFRHVHAQVVLALSKRGGCGHVPYRSSKLTHFLKDAIGGNCRTLLIACIWSDVRSSSGLSFCQLWP